MNITDALTWEAWAADNTEEAAATDRAFMADDYNATEAANTILDMCKGHERHAVIRAIARRIERHRDAHIGDDEPLRREEALHRDHLRYCTLRTGLADRWDGIAARMRSGDAGVAAQAIGELTGLL